MTSELHHIALGAHDPERVAAFYRDLLLLPERRRFSDADGVRSVWLGLGAAVLMVERTSEHRPRIEGVDAGAFLIAVRAPDGRAGRAAALAAAGIERESATEFTDYYRDPEGNRVAVSDYPV